MVQEKEKKFLNEASFSPEDSLNDFEFGQAYTNWLTLIETVSDPMVELGWCMHHKRMTVVHEFLDWEPAWWTHDCLLHTHFMLKPFIWTLTVLYMRSNLNACKLNQALLGGWQSHVTIYTHHLLCPITPFWKCWLILATSGAIKLTLCPRPDSHPPDNLMTLGQTLIGPHQLLTRALRHPSPP